ncbi:DNA gyrase inhibitor YacG [Pseudoroseomonas globiformis]|uniref:DNA gyrase inhibitor YacG n=1 Tax=Teichococcus globiformis TaxID=2307229 RepID=A0ABV7G182_9PROT
MPREKAPGAPRGRPACPICGKAPQPGFRPFCSARCKQVDLGRWLKGAYAIPGEPPAPEDEEQG